MTNQPPREPGTTSSDASTDAETTAASAPSAGGSPSSTDGGAGPQAASRGSFFATATQDPPATAPGRTGQPPKKRRNFFRRHLALTSLLVILLLFVGTAGGFVWYLNHQLGNVQQFGYAPKPLKGPDGSVLPDSGRPLNILVLGADNGGDTQTVAQDLADGTWTRGAHRSDTIMLMHIPADRQSAQIISIPRDSWVSVPTFAGDIDGKAKINAAFSWGGPALAVRTIQNFTGLHIDHVAMVDWNGFKDLTDALGGVRIYIPETFTDDSQHITWTKGWHTMNGDLALKYVRTRHGLANGDFGRIERQQNFLRTEMGSLLSSSTFTNPIKLAHVVGSFSSFLEVDSSWSTSDLRGLGLSLRHLRSSDVQFTTAPLGGYDVVAGQDIVRLDEAKCKVLFHDFSKGDLTPYLQANPGSSLPGSQSVH